MECTAEYSLSDGNGRKTARGEVRLALDGEGLSVLPRPRGELYYSLRDILGIEAGDYRIRLRLAGAEELILSGLGYSYEDFLLQLYQGRNELILQDLLMAEKLRLAGTAADLLRYGADGREIEKSQGEVRLYETALVVMPRTANLVRIPYSDITESRAGDYRLLSPEGRGVRV